MVGTTEVATVTAVVEEVMTVEVMVCLICSFSFYTSLFSDQLLFLIPNRRRRRVWWRRRRVWSWGRRRLWWRRYVSLFWSNIQMANNIYFLTIFCCLAPWRRLRRWLWWWGVRWRRRLWRRRKILNFEVSIFVGMIGAEFVERYESFPEGSAWNWKKENLVNEVIPEIIKGLAVLFKS